MTHAGSSTRVRAALLVMEQPLWTFAADLNHPNMRGGAASFAKHVYREARRILTDSTFTAQEPVRLVLEVNGVRHAEKKAFAYPGMSPDDNEHLARELAIFAQQWVNQGRLPIGEAPPAITRRGF